MLGVLTHRQSQLPHLRLNLLITQSELTRQLLVGFTVISYEVTELLVSFRGPQPSRTLHATISPLYPRLFFCWREC